MIRAHRSALRWTAGVGLATLVALGSRPVWADPIDYTARSTTFARGFAMPGATDVTNHLGFLELVTLDTRDLGVEGLSMHASLWGQVAALDLLPPNGRTTGDVNVLYAGYRAPYKSKLRGLELRVGRQLVAAGPSIYEQLDGGYASYRTPWGVDVTVFGGTPTGVRFFNQPWVINDDDATYGYNWVVGGRVGYRFRNWINVGTSYRHKRYHGRQAFDEIGFDFTSTPHRRVTLLGDGVVGLITKRMKEGRAAVRVTFLPELSAGAGYRYVSPDLFIPRSSIFAVFSQETYQEGFLELYWRPWRWASFTAEAAPMIYADGCTDGPLAGGQQTCDDGAVKVRAELRSNLRLGRERRHRLAVVLQRMGAPDGGYFRGRIGATSPLWRALSGTLEANVYLLDGRDNSQTYAPARDRVRVSLVTSGYLRYQVLSNLSVLAGGRFLVNQLLEKAGAFTVRLTWTLDSERKSRGVSYSRTPLQAPLIPAGGIR